MLRRMVVIVCIGESLIDVVDGRDVVGGCPLNVALAASRLGASAALFSKVSSDELGSLILEKLIDNCVVFDPRLCSSPLHTLKGQAVVDGDGKASYSFDWEGSATVSFSEDELKSSFSSMTDIDFVMTGSLGTVLPPGCDVIFPAIETIKPRPVVFYDPNVRPVVISSMKDFRRKMMEYIAQCDIVKVSDDDLGLVSGVEGGRPLEAELSEFCMSHGVHLLITRGSRGSSWIAPGFSVDVPAAKVDGVVDTIGCGDTFSGAVLFQLQRLKDGLCIPTTTPPRVCLDSIGEDEARAMLEFASKAAALNCLVQGCDPPTYGKISGSMGV